jgi:hypothetical protein
MHKKKRKVKKNTRKGKRKETGKKVLLNIASNSIRHINLQRILSKSEIGQVLTGSILAEVEYMDFGVHLDLRGLRFS